MNNTSLTVDELPSTQSMKVDLQAIMHLLIEKAWLIALCLVLGGLLGGAYVLQSKKIFSSRAVVQVEQAEQKVVNIQNVKQEDLREAEVIRTIEQNLGSRALLLRVVQADKLAMDRRFVPSRTTPYTDNELTDKLERQVTVKLRRGTRLIDITVEDAEPKLAEQLANSVVREYFRQSFDQQRETAKLANEFLVEEADRLKAKLEKSEQALQEYKEQNRAVSLEEKQNIIVDKLKDLNQKLTAANTDRLKLEADLAQVQKLAGHPAEELLTIPSVASVQIVVDAKRALSIKEGELAMLSQRYKPLHPKYIQAQSQISELRSNLNAAISKASNLVATLYAAARETEQKYEDVLHEQERLALELNKISIPFHVLSREVDSDRTLYEQVLSRLKETNVIKDIGQNNIRVVEHASLSETPIKPRKVRIMLLSVMGGLFVSLGLVFGLNAMDSSIKTVDKAEEQLGLPVLAAVPKHDKVTLTHNRVMFLLKEPQSAIAEAFRTLRTALSLLGKESDRKSFLFTSAIPSEGKSFCSSNYAVALAQQGLRTVLIDADLRLPVITKTFTLDPTHLGVSDFLVGRAPFEQIVQKTDVENLCVISAGSKSPNPSELLSGSNFGDLLKHALMKFDRVVIDSAPVNAVSDTLLLLKFVQSVCLVVHAGKTPSKAVSRACVKLYEAGSKPVGVVLNRMPQHAGAGYYYYYSSGEYSGVYGASNGSPNGSNGSNGSDHSETKEKSRLAGWLS